MDLRDILKSFFGFDRNNDNLFERKTHFSNNFNDFESEMSRDFEDIVQTFGQMFEVFNQFSISNDINDSNRWSQLDTDSRNPRDLMLKSSDDNRRQDIDLDQRVRKNGLNSILNENSTLESNTRKDPFERKTFRNSYFYSSISNNGRFEEQKTTTDELGNTETFVTKRVGDKSITQIVKRNNRNQIIETKEIVDNLDKNDINLFKDQFSPINDQNYSSDDNSNHNSFFSKIFGNFFKS